MEIFAVGMGGRRNRNYLSSIAYDRYHVFNAASTVGLRTIVEGLVAKICAATPIGKPTPTSKLAGSFSFLLARLAYTMR